MAAEERDMGTTMTHDEVGRLFDAAWEAAYAASAGKGWDEARRLNDSTCEAGYALAAEAERRGREAARKDIAAWLERRAGNFSATAKTFDKNDDDYRADEARTKSLELRAVASALRTPVTP